MAKKTSTSVKATIAGSLLAVGLAGAGIMYLGDTPIDEGISPDISTVIEIPYEDNTNAYEELSEEVQEQSPTLEAYKTVILHDNVTIFEYPEELPDNLKEELLPTEKQPTQFIMFRTFSAAMSEKPTSDVDIVGNIYILNNINGLKWFVDTMNGIVTENAPSDITFSEKTIYLRNDIIIYEDIGTGGKFNGNFFGQYYTLGNLQSPLFDTIENARVEKVEFSASTNLINVAIQSKLENITATVFIDTANETTGGIVNTIDGCTLAICRISGSIKGQGVVGGAAGICKNIPEDNIVNITCQAELIGTTVGGIFGIIDNSYIADTKFTGIATGEIIGGIAGIVEDNVNIKNWDSSGTLNGTENSIMGGIIGVSKGVNKIINSCSTSSLTAFESYYTGGLIGKLEEETEIKNCYSESQIKLQFGQASPVISEALNFTENLQTYNGIYYKNSVIISDTSEEKLSPVGNIPFYSRAKTVPIPTTWNPLDAVANVYQDEIGRMITIYDLSTIPAWVWSEDEPPINGYTTVFENFTKIAGFSEADNPATVIAALNEYVLFDNIENNNSINLSDFEIVDDKIRLKKQELLEEEEPGDPIIKYIEYDNGTAIITLDGKVPQNSSLIVAEMTEDDRPIKITMKKTNLNTAYFFDIPTQNTKYIRALLWYDLENIQPLCEKKEHVIR